MRCLIHKRKIHRSLDEATVLPSQTAHHVEQCVSCRRLYEAERGVTEVLQSAEAAQPVRDVSALHGRIMASLPDPGAANEVPGVRLTTALGAAAAVFLLLSAAFYVSRVAPNRDFADVPVVPSEIAGGQWIELAAQIEMTATSPYHEEMESLTEDFGGAAELLVACLGQ